ncbi:MAG: acyltransferase family protein, partial [Acidimicrobiia bacterium]
GVAVASAVSFTGSYLLSSGRGSTLMGRWVGATPDRVAFFSPATRAWEFGVGIACALVPVGVVAARRSAWRVASVAGGVSGAWSAVALDVRDRFPGTTALAPVFGTAALILAGAGDPATARALSAPWLTWIGDRSYGWYLWHWPLIVAAGALWPDRPWVLIVASIVALGPTIVSYAYLEQPIRRRADLRGRRALALGVACTAIPLALTGPTAAGASAISRRPFEVRDAWTESRAAVLRGCFGVDQRSWDASRCLVGGSGGPAVGLAGDSHAASISDGVIAAGGEWPLAIATQPGCPLMRLGPLGSDGCAAATAETLAIVDRVGARVIVIANAATRYTWDGQVIPRSEAAGGGLPRSAEERRETYVDAYVRTVEALVAEGRRVVVILEVPTMTFSKRVSLLRPNPAPRVTPLADQVDRNEIARMIVERLGGDDRVSIVDPAPILCPGGACSPIVGGEWAYMEASHLNPYGASLLSGVIGEAIDAQLAPAAG